MGCCEYYAMSEGHETTFTVDPSAITFGPGALSEVGPLMRAQGEGLERIALFTDALLLPYPHVGVVRRSLESAGFDVVLFDEVRVEPTDLSFLKAATFAKEGNFDGYVSVGGGSVIDTCKAANLYATHPADFLSYVNAPVGEGREVPGPLKPHIACPTTSGTGSECTGIAIFDLLSLKAKTGIASRHLKPSCGVIDPNAALTLPANIVASSAFDVLSHALESFTARPYTRRKAPGSPLQRPISQGANPWSDMGCREALRLLGKYLVRAVEDPGDREARSQVMWASTLAGIAFGNSGVHAPHGMSYSVAGLVKGFRPPHYPQQEPMVPHGMSVIVNAPSVFRWSAAFAPERHLEAARLLGGDSSDAGPEDAGEVLAEILIALMRACEIPNGLAGVGYRRDDIPALVEGAIVQERLLNNAPEPITREVLTSLYDRALQYW